MIAPTALELVVTLVVLSAVCSVTDAAAQRILGLPWRIESSLITAHILLFVLRPTLDLAALAGIAIAGIVASLSKYLLAWRGRHIFNPAAVGATVLTVLSIWWPALGASSWWVGTPVLAAPVVVLGLLVLLRTEKVRIVAVFLLVSVAVAVLRVSAQYQAVGTDFPVSEVFWQILWSSPFLFLGAFMLSEPLTMPPRRWQQLTIAAIVGVLAGWPIPVGDITLGQERALLVGNAVAFVFAFSLRSAVRLSLVSRTDLTPTVRAAHLPHAQPARLRPRPVPRARGAAPASRCPRHATRVQHRLGTRGPARAHRRLPRGGGPGRNRSPRTRRRSPR